MPRLYAGTSGFSYAEWRGAFYPADLPAGGMLAFYSRAFPSVEINNTFYRFPTFTHVEQWRKATPRGFRFSVKAHRAITHERRLRDADELVRVLVERVASLKDRLGPVLFQLPPSLRRDLALLRDFLLGLPRLLRVVEFRHPSWFEEETYALLEEHRTALAIMESDEDEPVLAFRGPFAYLRLHRSSYDDGGLRRWAALVEEQLAAGKDVYAYFTHDGTPGYEYARALQRLTASA